MSTEPSLPLVSAVIPTRNRPDLVCRAVRSALGQTYSNLEVVVVIDGPDAATVTALEALGDARVRIIALEQNVGGSEARNTGVRNSKGDWVAFLDDDDEWLPQKIEKQMVAGQRSLDAPMFVACQFIEKDAYGDHIAPNRGLPKDRSFSEYLFCRTGFGNGSGYLQTSTWLVSKSLAKSVPFTRGLKRNQDVDWMLHAMAQPGVKCEVVMEPLVVFHSEQNQNRVSKAPDWRFHLGWAKSNVNYLTGKSLGHFLSTTCAEDAAKQNQSIKAFWTISTFLAVRGNLFPKSLLLLAYYAFIPVPVRRRLHLFISRARRRANVRENREAFCGEQSNG